MSSIYKTVKCYHIDTSWRLVLVGDCISAARILLPTVELTTNIRCAITDISIFFFFIYLLIPSLLYTILERDILQEKSACTHFETYAM